MWLCGGLKASEHKAHNDQFKGLICESHATKTQHRIEAYHIVLYHCFNTGVNNKQHLKLFMLSETVMIFLKT